MYLLLKLYDINERINKMYLFFEVPGVGTPGITPYACSLRPSGNVLSFITLAFSILALLAIIVFLRFCCPLTRIWTLL